MWQTSGLLWQSTFASAVTVCHRYSLAFPGRLFWLVAMQNIMREHLKSAHNYTSLGSPNLARVLFGHLTTNFLPTP
jgi:hypothetical protein